MKMFKSSEFWAIPKSFENEYFGVVYALEYGDQIKIGSTNKPYERMRALTHNAQKYGDTKIGSVAFTTPHSNFRSNETLLHRKFASKRKEGTELFNITLEEAIKAFSGLEYLDESEKMGQEAKAFVGGMKDFWGWLNERQM